MKKILVLVIAVITILACFNTAYADDSWTCFGCGTNNTGKFCGKCGMSKADSEAESEIEAITSAVVCKHEESIICLERSEKWFCLFCGATNETDFCTNCGCKRDSGLKGSFVYLGAYEQDNNEDNGPEAIEWIVLEDNGSNILIISRYGLDSEPFDVKCLTNVWEDCTLRKWLNAQFYNTAFTEDEKCHIISSSITTDGGETTDNVFLLSTDEAETYFESDEARICFKTPFVIAKEKDEYVYEYSWWWLRSSVWSSSYKAARVSPQGFKPDHGYGGYLNEVEDVRPALLVNIT